MKTTNIRKILVPIDFSKMSIKAMAMLHRGKIIADGTPRSFKESTNPVVVQFLNGTTEGPILERSRYHMLSLPD